MTAGFAKRYGSNVILKAILLALMLSGSAAIGFFAGRWVYMHGDSAGYSIMAGINFFTASALGCVIIKDFFVRLRGGSSRHHSQG